MTSKRKHLQEIYGEEDDEVKEDGEDEISNALSGVIAKLKEKYGSEWASHIEDEGGVRRGIS